MRFEQQTTPGNKIRSTINDFSFSTADKSPEQAREAIFRNVFPAFVYLQVAELEWSDSIKGTWNNTTCT